MVGAPGARVLSVSGVMPTALPSISTVAPVGVVSISTTGASPLSSSVSGLSPACGWITVWRGS